jgi:endonuclease/exonuclease/phosphatase family metal-dependent hydrolase
MRRLVLWVPLVLVACTESEEMRMRAGMPVPGGSIRVVTYNLYLGTDLESLFPTAPDPSSAAESVAAAFRAVQASDPRARADAVAARLAAVAPDVVALQEVALWRTQVPADGATTAATDVAYDFLELVVDALARRGLAYTAFSTTHTDVEVTGAFAGGLMDVRFTDRDVLLLSATAGLPVVGSDQGNFSAVLVVPTAFGVVHVPRGWVALDIRLADRPIRVVNTHLEAVAPAIRDLQADELLAGPAAASPLILTGDFNFDADTLVYRKFIHAALVDQSGASGPTCCQASDLRNPVSELADRIDLVFTRGPIAATAVGRLGAEATDRTAGGLWPSDHAGVSATLDLMQ